MEKLQRVKNPGLDVILKQHAISLSLSLSSLGDITQGVLLWIKDESIQRLRVSRGDDGT